MAIANTFPVQFSQIKFERRRFIVLEQARLSPDSCSIGFPPSNPTLLLFPSLSQSYYATSVVRTAGSIVALFSICAACRSSVGSATVILSSSILVSSC